MTRKSAKSETLFRAFRERGDEASYEELVRRHWAHAYRLAHHCLRDADAAQDVAQDVFVQVARAEASFTDEGDFMAWLRTLIYNAVRMHVRGRDRRRRRETVAAERRASSARHEGERSVEAAEVREHLSGLPLELRFAVALRYFEDLSHREVALALGCAQGTASSRIRRGLEQLRESLAGAGFAVTVPGIKGILRVEAPVDVPPPPSAKELLASTARGALGVKLGGIAAAALLLLATGWAALGGGDAEPPPRALAAAETPANDPGEDASEAPAQVLPASDDPANAGPPLAPGTGDDEATEEAVEEGVEGTDEVAEAAEAPVPPANALGMVDRSFTVRGRILHAETNQPLAGVAVHAFPHWEVSGSSMTNGAPKGTTDAAGAFELKLRLQASRDAVLGGATLITRAEGFLPFARTLSVDALSRPRDLLLEPGRAAWLHGVTVRSDGTPAGNVRLSATVQGTSAEQGRVLGEPDPEPRLLERAPTFSLRSDAEGRFRLDGLFQGPASITVDSGQAWASSTHGAEAAVDPPEARIVLSSGASVTVQVFDEGGAPLDDAEVTLAPAGETWGSSTVTRRGEATFKGTKPGDYQVKVRFSAGTGSRRLFDQSVDVHLRAGASEVVRIQQAPADERGVVIAEVRDEAGQPVAGAKVWLREAGSERWTAHEEVISDAEGLARFPKVPHGRYELQVSEEHSGAPEASVRLDGAEERVLLTTKARRVITGTVVDEAGRPVPAAKVTLFPYGGGSGTTTGCDEQGRFAFDPYPAGLVSVDASAKGYTDSRQTLKNEGKPWRLVLSQGRALEVTGRADAPDGTRVVAQLEMPMSSRGTFGKVINGAFRLSVDGLAPDDSGTVWVRVGKAVPVQAPLARGQVEVDLGALALELGYTVRGRVVAPPEWMKNLGKRKLGFIGVGTHSNIYDDEIAADGTFEVRGLAPEPFKLQVGIFSKDLDSSMTRTLHVDPVGTPDLGVIELKLEDRLEEPEFTDDFDCLKMRIKDPSGLLGTLGFEDGDLVVGLNGKSWKGPLELEQVFSEAFGTPPNVNRGPVTFNVLRGGEAVDLVVIDYMGQVMQAGPENAGGVPMPHKR